MRRGRSRLAVAAAGVVAAVAMTATWQPTTATYTDHASLRSSLHVPRTAPVAQSDASIVLIDGVHAFLYDKGSGDKGSGVWKYVAKVPENTTRIAGVTNTAVDPDRSEYLMANPLGTYWYSPEENWYHEVTGLPGPPGPIGSVVNGAGDGVHITSSNGRWFYMDSDNRSWTENYPQGQLANPTVMSGSGRRIVMTDGSQLRVSDDYGNTWKSRPAPTTGIKYLAYAHPLMILFGEGGWYQSTSEGWGWDSDATLNDAIPAPTAAAGAKPGGRPIIASGTQNLWFYDVGSHQLTRIPPPP